MNIPASIRAGSTVKWRESSQVDPFGDALQSTDSWAMKFCFLLLSKNAVHGMATTKVQTSDKKPILSDQILDFFKN